MSTTAQKPCKFFAKRTCKFGDQCKDSHAVVPLPTIARHAAAMTACPHFVRGTCKFGDECRLSHSNKGTVGVGGGKPAASFECPICCCSKESVATTSCCGQKVCYGCIKTVVVCKQTLAAELKREFLGKAHQCPKCAYGPVEHFACSDLTSGRNACPKCKFFSPSLAQWHAWDGTLPPAFRSMEGHFPCPFCRKDSALSAAFGKGTTVCSRCKKMGHTKAQCTFIECRQCGRPGHLAKDCTDVVCFVCKKRGHRSSDCRYKK